MDLRKLGEILEKMYAGAQKGEKVTMIHLFGIKFADLISENGYKPLEVVKAAGINASYATEVSKGINLAKYVKIK